MDRQELAWLGLWTLVAYAPAAFTRLRALPLPEALSDAGLQGARLGREAHARVVDAIRGAVDVEMALVTRARDALRQAGQGTLALPEAEVPGSAETTGAPPWFWARGNSSLLDRHAPGRACVVGSRRTDAAGARMTRQIVTALCHDGWTIVSGGAIGIDATAHRAALDAGGATIAVLPSGLDRPYPDRHARMFAEIVDAGGLLLSPFPPGHRPRNWHFARRNLAMAAMSEATIVVRASPKSGSLITGRAAQALGRRVFAVPADAWRREQRGTLELLAEGAEVLLDPEAPGLPPQRPSSTTAVCPAPAVSDGSRRVLRALAAGPLHGDELAAALRSPLHSLHGILLDLELDGFVRHDPGGSYALTSRGATV